MVRVAGSISVCDMDVCYVLGASRKCLLIVLCTLCIGYRGSTMVKVLCYKLEGRWFDASWCHWNFSLT